MTGGSAALPRSGVVEELLGDGKVGLGGAGTGAGGWCSGWSAICDTAAAEDGEGSWLRSSKWACASGMAAARRCVRGRGDELA